MLSEADIAQLTVMLIAGALSLTALFYLFQKHIDGRPLLDYEPRRRVPWGSAVALIAMAMPLLGALVYFFEVEQPLEQVVSTETIVGQEQSSEEAVSTETLLINGWGSFSFMVMFVVGMTAWIATFYRASASDLGMPTSWQQFAKDVRAGTLAVVAFLLPIHVIQLTLVRAFDSNTPHPLVKQLEEHNTPAMLILGFAMAVIAAPLFEEFTFRCLLQGWLERREDEALSFEATQRQPQILAEEIESDESLADTAESIPQLEDHSDTATMTRPSHGWIPILPHGWTPILISGTLFGLAHLGHGVAPISLVLFGIVLGYLYQRTHRLTPCITAHMVFNSYTMVLLWLQLEAPSVDEIVL